ncbi:hypothetical protein GTP58_16975 [Duganella sp. CY15W]|uniref:hypothetical protein n=1 Tax=Duganella sp. CY15W TaxID=2692172 RepID=UPI00137216EE|nr:hypothetical protein [Duganella sp. CY15W]MYM30026.1 hypothetical protein [Duganella sp. CY15W]
MSTLNFIPRSAPLQGWRLALAAVGAITLASAAYHWLGPMQEVQRLQHRLDTQAARSERSAARRNQPALSPQRQQALDKQLAVIAGAVRQLNLPVVRLLKTVQAPEDIHVALLGLDLNGQPPQDGESNATHTAATPAGVLKISAEAQTAQDMLNYLAFLNQQRLFRSVYLIKHEAAGDAYRFQLEALWRE